MSTYVDFGGEEVPISRSEIAEMKEMPLGEQAPLPSGENEASVSGSLLVMGFKPLDREMKSDFSRKF